MLNLYNHVFITFQAVFRKQYIVFDKVGSNQNEINQQQLVIIFYIKSWCSTATAEHCNTKYYTVRLMPWQGILNS